MNLDSIFRVGFYRARHPTVFRDDNLLSIDGGNHATSVGNDDDLRVTRNALFDTGADEWRFSLQERHTLTLHVCTHESAISIIVLKERDHSSRDRDDLLRRNVHVVHFLSIDFQELAVLTNGDLTDKVTLVVEFGVGLSNDLTLFLVGGEIFDLVGYLTRFHETIWRFDETKLVDASVS